MHSRLFIQGARILEFEKLREIIGDYQQLNYAKGAVELPLRCAEVLDGDSQGREYWYNGSPSNDPRAEAWQRRSNCYDLVLDSLQVFEDRCDKTNGASPSLYDDPETVRTHAYELAFSADDEMFHSTLYDWLIGRGIADELLEVCMFDDLVVGCEILITERLDATGVSGGVSSQGSGN